jgi:hypothetical protein
VRDVPGPVPPGALAHPGAGFGGAEAEGETTARWLEAPEGEIELVVAGPTRPLTLRLEVASFTQARRVSVRRGGPEVGAFDVPADTYRTVSVPLGRVQAGLHIVTLVPVPGPQSIQEATGTPDARSVSIRLRGPVVASSQGAGEP